jgi:hypothetical protein
VGAHQRWHHAAKVCGLLLRPRHQHGAPCCAGGRDALLQLLQLLLLLQPQLLLELCGVLAQQLQLLGRQHRPRRACPCLLH